MMIGFRFLTIHGAAHFFSHIDVNNENNVDNRNILCYNVDTVIIPRCRAGCNGRKACHKGYSKVERWLLPREAGRATARVPTTPLRLCWRMKEILECALIQGDRKGSPLLYTAWGAALFVYSRGGACPRPAALHFLYLSPAKSYNDGDSRERVERLLRSPERAIEGALLRSSTGIASDWYVWCFLFKTRCDRTTASPISYCKTPTNAATRVLTCSANDACASTDFVSQAERKALLTSVSQVGERRSDSYVRFEKDRADHRRE